MLAIIKCCVNPTVLSALHQHSSCAIAAIACTEGIVQLAACSWYYCKAWLRNLVIGFFYVTPEISIKRREKGELGSRGGGGGGAGDIKTGTRIISGFDQQSNVASLVKAYIVFMHPVYHMLCTTMICKSCKLTESVLGTVGWRNSVNKLLACRAKCCSSSGTSWSFRLKCSTSDKWHCLQ